MIGATAVAAAGGCTVDEGAAHPCRIFGVDIDALLYTLGGMGWLGLVALPTGAVALALYAMVTLVAWLRTLWSRRKHPQYVDRVNRTKVRKVS